VTDATIAAIAAYATAAVNLGAGAYAGWLWWRVQPGRAVWPALRTGQAVAGAQAVVAGGLAVAGYEPDDGLYWLYALLPVAIGVIAEQLRIAAAEQVLENRELENAQAVGRLPEHEQRSVVLAIIRREVGVLALAAVVVAFLALRAALVV
jgi:hypothetical protein